MKIKKYLVTFGAAAAMVAPTFLSSVVANADAVQPQRQQQGHKQDNAKAAKQVGGKNLSQQPRETGSQYTNDNSGYNVTVKATNLINTLHYNVKTSTIVAPPVLIHFQSVSTKMVNYTKRLVHPLAH